MSDTDHSDPAAIQQVDAIRSTRGQWAPGQSGNPEMCWKPGQSGRPAGRPQIGLSILEWANEMAGWSEEETEAARHADQPNNKAIAANIILLARSVEKNASGNPVAVQSIKDLLDRFAGKPMQQVQVTQLTHEQIDLTRLDPTELATFRDLLGKATGHSLPTA